jgi:hypothetical protein
MENTDDYKLQEGYDLSQLPIMPKGRYAPERGNEPLLTGVPGHHLLQFTGTIDSADLDLMSQAIEEGCEQIDLDE